MSVSHKSDAGFALADVLGGLFIAALGASSVIWAGLAGLGMSGEARARLAAQALAEELLTETEIAARGRLQSAGGGPEGAVWRRHISPWRPDGAPQSLWRVHVEVDWAVGRRSGSYAAETLLFRPDWGG